MLNPEVAGTIIGLKEGERSNPIKGVGGVYVVWSEGQVQTGDPIEFAPESFATQLREGLIQSAGDGVEKCTTRKSQYR